MFEFDKYERAKHVHLPIVPNGELERFPKPKKAAFLLWGEHCVECAAPDCYTTCDLYVARPDSRCRRFAFGIYENRNFTLNRSGCAEVVFGRWAKLEARGNAYLINGGFLALTERVAKLSSKALNCIGPVIASVTKDMRWKYAAFALLERVNVALRKARLTDRPDGFLVDIYNPGTAPVTLSVGMAISRPKTAAHLGDDDIPRPFSKVLTLPPGRYRELIPYVNFSDIVECRLPFNLSLLPSEEGAHLVFIALNFVQFHGGKQSARSQEAIALPTSSKELPKAKCVVFDLDNTLWDGVLLENENVRLRRGLNALLRKLDERGILLSIVSKNSHDHAIGKLKELGAEEFFLFPRINWGPKSENLKSIAKDLDIGIDTFIFVDDNPFELDEVYQAIPMVECIHVDHFDALLDHPRLQGSTSPEARARRQMYREAMTRVSDQTVFGDDYLAFLKSCRIQLTVRRNQPADLERICELIQRTNQLNFSGRKYARDEIDPLLNDPSLEHYVLICEDKYGSYGTIGFCMVRRAADSILIEDLMLSCRVQGKFVEAALFDFLSNGYAAGGPPLKINFRRTSRNTPAQNILTRLGFGLNQDGYVVRNPDAPKVQVDFIEVRSNSAEIR